MTQIDRIECFTKQFHKVLASYGAASPATNNAFFLVQAAVMGMDESTMFDWADAECARLKDITLDQLPFMFSADFENSELALEKQELEEEELKTFQEELEEQEQNVELAIKELFKFSNTLKVSWLIDLSDSKKIVFSANIEEQKQEQEPDMFEGDFIQELSKREQSVELAIKDLLKLTHAENAGWLIDLKDSKKIVFSASVEEKCPCCSVHF